MTAKGISLWLAASMLLGQSAQALSLIHIFYRLIVKLSRVSGLIKKLESHLEDIAQSAYKN